MIEWSMYDEIIYYTPNPIKIMIPKISKALKGNYNLFEEGTKLKRKFSNQI